MRLEAPDSVFLDFLEFRVDVYTTKGYLDPATMEIKNRTTQEYADSDIAQNLIGTTIDSGYVISKSESTSIAGKDDAWRTESIGTLMGDQVSFYVKGYVLANDGKLYKLEFSTKALEAPKRLPIGEKIIQSFRFI